jgi:hypothetical protein
VGTLANCSPICDKQTWHESWVHPCSNSLKMASFMFFRGNSQKNSLICLKMGYFMSFHRNSWPSSPFKKGAEIGGVGLGLGLVLLHFKKFHSKWNKYWTYNLEIWRTGLQTYTHGKPLNKIWNVETQTRRFDWGFRV